MKTWKKVAIGVGGAAVLAIIVLVSIQQANKDVVTVQTGTVKPEDLSSIVTASGEVRPLNYTNVLGQGFGLITDIVVKEGDHVKKGALVRAAIKKQALRPYTKSLKVVMAKLGDDAVAMGAAALAAESVRY